MPKISVPFIEQRNRSDCLVACIAMVLAWARSTYKETANLDYDEIAKVLKWSKDGTPIENVELINTHHEIRKHPFQPEFHFGWATGISLIWDEINKRRPIIVYLLREHLDSLLQHAIVVVGYTNDKTKIYCHDPLDGENIAYDTGDFQSKWDALFRTNAHVTVVERRDTTLDDFVEDELE